MKYCDQCGTQLNDEDKFCFSCGTWLSVEDLPGSFLKKDDKEVDNMVSSDNQSNNKQNPPRINIWCLALIAVCAFVWFKGPFVAVNLLTMGDQPTAYQIVTDDVLVIGDLEETSVYWAAVGTIIGLIICCVTALCKGNKVVRIVALVSEVPLLIVFLDYISAIDDIEELFDVYGFGFWGLLILLAIIAYVGGQQRDF